MSETMTNTQWKVGDWCILDFEIGQITEMRDNGGVDFSDGSFSTSGRLIERFRPLTLRNKNIAEWFKAYYGYLRKIDGEAGFNYPRIANHFENLCREAIDGDPDDRQPFDNARAFVQDAREHKAIIQGVALFRPSRN